MLIAALGAAFLWMASVPAAAAPTQAVDTAAVAGGTTARATDQARQRVAALIAQRDRERAQKAELARVYEKQLAEIDRLKQQRASWRRDRQIRDRMSESHSTAQKLAGLDARVRELEAKVRKERRELLAAIERELAGAPAPQRKDLLVRWRRGVQQGLKGEVKKIVIPDDSIDPLADPEELEYQASLLRQSEDELARELARLDKQAKRYRHMVELRVKRNRAAELGDFDESQPRRSTGHTGTDRTSGASDEAGAPPPTSADPASEVGDGPPGDGPLDDVDGGDDPMFDVVLADVVDASTIHALRAAEGSSDPAVKARAAEQAVKQVKERLERLQKRRAIIQKRARSLEAE